MSGSQQSIKKKKPTSTPETTKGKKSPGAARPKKSGAVFTKKNQEKPAAPKQRTSRFQAFKQRVGNSWQRYEVDFQLFLIPLILLIVLLIVYMITNSVEQTVQARSLPKSMPAAHINPYPVLSPSVDPVISAESAIVLDDASKVVIYAKNPTLRFSMASTTKVMTALVALDYYHPTSVITIDRPTVEGSKVGFHQGEKLTFSDVLYGLLLPSGNDAAYALGDNYPGGLNAFVAAMNAKAHALHLFSTHYADPAGLDDNNDYTVVTDLARLSSIALQNKTFATVVGTKSKVITTLNTGTTYDLLNLNELLGTDGVTGIKTGTTEEAGEVLITSQVINGHTFIIIVMRSQDRFADTETLMNLVTSKVRYIYPEKQEGN